MATFTLTASAQTLIGDMNDDGKLSVIDVTHLNEIITGHKAPQYVLSGTGAPYLEDNNVIEGTWYRSSTSSITFRADGTTDYPGATSYRFHPWQGTIFIYDADEALQTILFLRDASNGNLLLSPLGSGSADSFGETQPHDCVDLGLPSGTLWSVLNLGATLLTDAGDYFAWGATAPQDTYNWANCPFGKGTSSSNIKFEKYCFNSAYGLDGLTDGLTQLEECDDPATVLWGEEWCTPTLDDFQELLDNTTANFVDLGEEMLCLTSTTNGEKIYFPLNGTYKSGTAPVIDAGSAGRYWCRDLSASDTRKASNFLFRPDPEGIDHTLNLTILLDRYLGLGIRPVMKIDQ